MAGYNSAIAWSGKEQTVLFPAKRGKQTFYITIESS